MYSGIKFAFDNLKSSINIFVSPTKTPESGWRDMSTTQYGRRNTVAASVLSVLPFFCFDEMFERFITDAVAVTSVYLIL